jgi:ATP/maltotriose-dependent transcriptional regulator MalT
MNNMKVFWHTFREIDTLPFLLGKISGFLSTYGIQDLALHLDNKTNSPSIHKHRIGSSLYDSSSLDITIDALKKLGDCIIVFDDYQKVKDENITVFLRHLQQHYKNKLIMISRSRPPFFLDSIKSKEIVLSGLPFDEAKRMFSDFQVNPNAQVLKNVWKKTEGHPMALKILSSLLTTRKKEVSEVNEKEKKDYDYSQTSIDKLQLYLQREILETLNEDELDILLTLCIYRNPVKAWALKRKSRNDKVGRHRSMNYLLHSLEKKMLVNRTSNHEFYLHDLLKDILYSMLAYPEDAHSSAAQYYMSEGRADSMIEALYHLARSHNLSRIFEILEEEVVNERYRFIEEGYAASLVEILRQVSIPNNINKSKLAYLYGIQGKALSMLEKWDEASERLGEAIKVARFYSSLSSDNINNSDLLVAHSMRIISESFYLQGDFVAVEKYLLQAAAIFQEYRNMERVLHDVYLKLARLYFATGRNEESKSYSDLANSLIDH